VVYTVEPEWQVFLCGAERVLSPPSSVCPAGVLCRRAEPDRLDDVRPGSAGLSAWEGMSDARFQSSRTGLRRTGAGGPLKICEPRGLPRWTSILRYPRHLS